jgi:hypothetical protein
MLPNKNINQIARTLAALRANIIGAARLLLLSSE